MNVEGLTFKQKVQVYFVCYREIELLNNRIKDMNLSKEQEKYIDRIVGGIRLKLEENGIIAEMLYEDTNLGNLRHVIHTISQEDNITYEQMEDNIGLRRGTVKELTSNGHIEPHQLRKLCNYYELGMDNYRRMYSY